MTRIPASILALLLALLAPAAASAEPAPAAPAATAAGAAPSDSAPEPTGGAKRAHAEAHAAPSVNDRPLDPPRISVRSIAVADVRTILVAAPGPAEGVARQLAAKLPEERRALDRLLGLDDTAPIEIRVGYGREEFRALQPASALAPGWAAGVAYPAWGLIVLDAQASERSGGASGVLRHELAHVALGRLLRTRIPHWFTEGFAMLYADEWTLSRSAVLARASAASALIPLDDIDRSWPTSPTDVDLAYAQGASIVAYLASRDGGAPFHRLVAAMAAGTPFDDAMVAAYGQPLVVHELAWKQTLRARYGWLPVFFDHELLWGWAALLVVFGAWRLRRRKRRRLAAMVDEEPDPEDEEISLDEPPDPERPELTDERPKVGDLLH